MKKLLLLIITLILVIGFPALYRLIKKTESNRSSVFRIGIISGYAPYVLINSSGDYEGFDIDVAKALGTILAQDIVFEDMSLSALFIALQQGKIDFILSGLSITPERQQAMNMVYYQGEPTTSYPLVFWKEIPSDIKDIESFKNKTATLCVEAGSTQEKFLLSFDFLSLKQLNNNADIIFDLKYKKCAAALMDPDVIDCLTEQNPELKVLPICLPPQFQSSGCGIAIKKDNKQLTDQIRSTIQQLLDNGTLKILEEKWFKKVKDKSS